MKQIMNCKGEEEVLNKLKDIKMKMIKMIILMKSKIQSKNTKKMKKIIKVMEGITNQRKTALQRMMNYQQILRKIQIPQHRNRTNNRSAVMETLSLAIIVHKRVMNTIKTQLNQQYQLINFYNKITNLQLNILLHLLLPLLHKHSKMEITLSRVAN